LLKISGTLSSQSRSFPTVAEEGMTAAFMFAFLIIQMNCSRPLCHGKRSSADGIAPVCPDDLFK
jgi:hypothetical protein